MTTGTITNYYTSGPISGGKPKQVVLLLHGLGADGQDLIGLAPELSRDLPDAIFISPDAPFPCDMAPMGFQWFSLQDWGQDAREKGVKSSAPILRKFMDEVLKKYDLPAGKLALVGFSQGTMMSLYVGPRYPDAIAGVVGFSGMLIGGEDADFAKAHKIPVCLIHGEADTVVPFMAYKHAKDALEKSGFPVSGHSTPGLPHSIDQRGIEAARGFLKNYLK
jgi:phospholipase/carboxylesterase